jgi:hypothetical protein
MRQTGNLGLAGFAIAGRFGKKSGSGDILQGADTAGVQGAARQFERRPVAASEPADAQEGITRGRERA